MRIGQICRFDNSGLGNLCWEFARNLKPEKVLLVENLTHQTFPERYADFKHKRVRGMLTPDLIDWFLEGIDVLWTAETFYDWRLVKEAKKRGIKTVLYTMYEMTPEKLHYFPDLLLCPSKLDYDVFKDYSTRVEYLPMPVATDRLHWNKRTTAKTFIHSASHGGVDGRKGTQLFLDAIPHVKSDVEFKIFTWKPFKSTDPRVKIEVKNFKNYWQLWREGDVLVYPQNYNGISLPVQEAFASGLGVISTDIYPFNEYLPKKLLYRNLGVYKTRVSKGLLEVDAVKIDPQDIAKKIDEYANKDISEFSEAGRKWAEENSWGVLKSKYLELFKDLCKTK